MKKDMRMNSPLKIATAKKLLGRAGEMSMKRSSVESVMESIDSNKWNDEDINFDSPLKRATTKKMLARTGAMSLRKSSSDSINVSIDSSTKSEKRDP